MNPDIRNPELGETPLSASETAFPRACACACACAFGAESQDAALARMFDEWAAAEDLAHELAHKK